MVLGAKRLGLKIEAIQLGGEMTRGKGLGGERSCYHMVNRPIWLWTEIDMCRYCYGPTSLVTFQGLRV